MDLSNDNNPMSLGVYIYIGFMVVAPGLRLVLEVMLGWMGCQQDIS
jgi:hypothetical protein